MHARKLSPPDRPCLYSSTNHSMIRIVSVSWFHKIQMRNDSWEKAIYITCLLFVGEKPFRITKRDSGSHQVRRHKLIHPFYIWFAFSLMSLGVWKGFDSSTNLVQRWSMIASESWIHVSPSRRTGNNPDGFFFKNLCQKQPDLSTTNKCIDLH